MITNDQKYIKLLNDIKKDGRLFTINNTINTAFTRRDYFLNSALYKSIVDATTFFDHTLCNRRWGRMQQG